ncbi:MAG: MBL fold metallo-hydrolase [Hymenobacter sp.]
MCRSLDYRDKRLRVSVHLAVEGRSLVIDTGPDFRQQMLRAYISQLDGILFTHEHKDHTAGLDDVRAFNFRQQQEMPHLRRAAGAGAVAAASLPTFSPSNKYPGAPQVSLHPITDDQQPFDVLGLAVQPLRALHYKLPVLGFRVGNLAYLTDANQLPPARWSSCAGPIPLSSTPCATSRTSPILR